MMVDQTWEEMNGNQLSSPSWLQLKDTLNDIHLNTVVSCHSTLQFNLLEKKSYLTGVHC